jgi:hypothetical protein
MATLAATRFNPQVKNWYKASPLRRQAEESRARRLHEKTASRTERNDQKQGSVA